MNTTSVNRRIYRVSVSKYWEQYWYPYPIGIIATFQLIMTFGTIAMEVGNAVVDLFRANVFSGFWSFPFMLSATIATYACVCTKKTQTKAMIALILQLISIFVILIVISFLIAFIATNFTLCLGSQCSQNSSTSFSSSTYTVLKRAFISCELVCTVLFLILSIIYIILYIKCYQKLPRNHSSIHPMGNRQLSSLSKTSRPWSMSTLSYNRSDIPKKKAQIPSATLSYYGAQKVCPNCQHISPYIPQGNMVECPKCSYQSPLVEHAQQW